MSLLSVNATPGTTITTTTETLAANVPASPVYEGGPGGGMSGIVIRGNVLVTTGATTASITVKLRTGQNNTTTGQVDQSETVISAAALTNSEASFEFVDSSLPVGGNLQNLGYSITVVQNAATGNGTVVAVNYEVDRSAA